MDIHAASWFELAGQFNLALLSAKCATGPVDLIGLGSLASAERIAALHAGLGSQLNR
jgi:hypothetical protein